MRWQVPCTKSNKWQVQIQELASPKKYLGISLPINHLSHTLQKWEFCALLGYKWSMVKQIFLLKKKNGGGGGLSLSLSYIYIYIYITLTVPFTHTFGEAHYIYIYIYIYIMLNLLTLLRSIKHNTGHASYCTRDFHKTRKPASNKYKNG